MRILRPGLLVACSSVAVSSLAAQSIYVDSGNNTTPSSAYGAAAGTPGYWNLVLNTSTHALLDVNGQPTSVVATTGPVCDDGGENFPTTSGDDGALLDDWNYADCYQGQLQFVLTGLRAGTYQLYLYPLGGGGGANFWLSTNAGGTIEGGINGTTYGLGPFTGSFATWHVPVRVVRLPSDGSTLNIFCSGVGLAGLQLVRLAEATTFCSGDQGWCPCGVGQPAAGCPSSFAPGGASLTGTGSMQVSSDTLHLTAMNVSNSVVTFFQGTTAHNLGLGTALADGLRCAGGSQIRLAAVQASGGIAQYPGPTDPSISLRGALHASGGFRAYQVSYRNSINYCTPSTFNLTNGVAVEWQP